MDWITEQVAIGNHREARDAALLAEHGFRSALSLDGTLDERDAARFGLAEVASYTLIDGPGNDLRVLGFAVADLNRLAAAHPPVLVQCHAGRSRSAVVVAAHLMAADGLDADAAIARVAARREVAITPALAGLLRKLGG